MLSHRSWCTCPTDGVSSNLTVTEVSLLLCWSCSCYATVPNVPLEMCDAQSKVSQLQHLQQKTEMELLDAQMFSASVDNELDDDGTGTFFQRVSWKTGSCRALKTVKRGTNRFCDLEWFGRF